MQHPYLDDRDQVIEEDHDEALYEQEERDIARMESERLPAEGIVY